MMRGPRAAIFKKGVSWPGLYHFAIHHFANRPTSPPVAPLRSSANAPEIFNRQGLDVMCHIVYYLVVIKMCASIGQVRKSKYSLGTRLLRGFFGSHQEAKKGVISGLLLDE